MRYRDPPRWRIYYADGSTFSNEDGEPWDAPGWGAQVICCEQDDGTAPPISGNNTTMPVDCYRWLGKSWCQGTFYDLIRYHGNKEHDGPPAVVMTREIEDKADFLKILERAIKEGVG